MWISRWTRKLGTLPGVGSNPTLDKNFRFYNFRL